jgi:hypothetical protein
LRSAAWLLRPRGRLAILMTHPCFRVPRQSGWRWDASRRLQYRRVDRYLTKLDVPIKAYGGARRGATIGRSPSTSTDWPRTVSWLIEYQR